MAENFYVGAYWGPRRESAAECAMRLSGCLSQLALAHPLLATWYLKGSSRAAASKVAVDASPENLLHLLNRGRNRRDIGGSIIEELGFRASLWNRQKSAVSLTVTCGSYLASGAVWNSVAIQLPPLGLEGSELYEPSTARAITRSIVDAWNPAWATWASYTMRDVQQPSSTPVFGWLTYLNSSLGARISTVPLPPDVSVAKDLNGIMVQIGEDPVKANVTQVLGLLAALDLQD